MKVPRIEKGLRTAATARRPMLVALGKPTPVHNANVVHMKRSSANDYRKNAGEQQVLFEHSKSGNRRLVAKFAEYKGHPYLDIREWVEGGESLTPTKKGISVPLSIMGKLGEALVTASKASEAGEIPRQA